MSRETGMLTGGSVAPAKVVSSSRIAELTAEARYHRERLELYRAKTYGPRPTSPTRLRELERMHLGAASRLRRAQQAPPLPEE